MGIRVMIGSNNNKIAAQLTQFLVENGMQVVGETTDAYDCCEGFIQSIRTLRLLMIK